jgi:hypothetical protein
MVRASFAKHIGTTLYTQMTARLADLELIPTALGSHLYESCSLLAWLHMPHFSEAPELADMLSRVNEAD